MTSIDSKKCSKLAWNELFQKVKRALVFMDNVSAEILHWHGGVSSMLSAGAYNVKEFSSFEVGK